MSGFKERSHLERLLQWRDERVVPPAELEFATFVSALIPTRRFGPAGWVAFLVGVSPRSTVTGELKAWVLYDASALRLVAYLARPLADTFGLVTPFELPGEPFDPAVAPVLGAVGEAFFAGGPPPPETAAVAEYFASLGSGYVAALVEAAPDFFQWIDSRDD